GGGLGRHQLQADALGIDAVEQAHAGAEYHRGEGDRELVDQAGVQVLEDRRPTAGDSYVPAVGDLMRPDERRLDAVVDEVERRSARPVPWFPLLVGQHEDRRVERRLLGPSSLAGVEHPLAHDADPGAGVGPLEYLVVFSGLTAVAQDRKS